MVFIETKCAWTYFQRVKNLQQLPTHVTFSGRQKDSDITQSEVYKMIHGIDQPRGAPRTAPRPAPPQRMRSREGMLGKISITSWVFRLQSCAPVFCLLCDVFTAYNYWTVWFCFRFSAWLLKRDYISDINACTECDSLPMHICIGYSWDSLWHGQFPYNVPQYSPQWERYSEFNE